MTERARSTGRLLFVSLGEGMSTHDDLWRSSGFVRDVVRFKAAAPSGKRRGSRALGLGVDSAIVALKVTAGGNRGPYLAVNPWVGAALKLMGKRHVSVTGIYAAEGTRSFRILRAVLRESPVLTTVGFEADAWNRSGGRAKSILYGTTFGYPRHVPKDDGVLRIFVGGSSDRDSELVQRLEQEVASSKGAVHLVVVADEEPSFWENSTSKVEHTGRLDATDFGIRMSRCDVVFLPVLNSGRAAGHMVTVGALETGIPVVSAISRSMDGYVDGEYVRNVVEGAPLLPQLASAAEIGRLHAASIHQRWVDQFSLEAYIRRVGDALAVINR
jgi:hypothetical protein